MKFHIQRLEDRIAPCRATTVTLQSEQQQTVVVACKHNGMIAQNMPDQQQVVMTGKGSSFGFIVQNSLGHEQVIVTDNHGRAVLVIENAPGQQQVAALGKGSKFGYVIQDNEIIITGRNGVQLMVDNNPGHQDVIFTGTHGASLSVENTPTMETVIYSGGKNEACVTATNNLTV